MNRKKFFTLFSVGLAGITLFKSNPLKYLNNKNKKIDSVKINITPSAVKREKSGK